MALLGKAAILAVDDRPTEEVEVKEWGGSVLVRGMDGRGRDAYFQSMAEQRGGQVVQNIYNASAKLCARCIVDPDTLEPLFDEAEAELLGRKSASALERVGQVAARLSGLTEEDMESLKKDSKSTQNGGSTSGSPVTLAAPSPRRSGRSARPS